MNLNGLYNMKKDFSDIMVKIRYSKYSMIWLSLLEEFCHKIYSISMLHFRDMTLCINIWVYMKVLF